MENTFKNIGWIGTGVMGKSMCQHLISSGYNLQVYNRTKSKTNDLVQLGAKYTEPQEMAQNCDAIFLMLGYPKDLENLLFNDQKLINYLKPGSYLIDHTTSSPSLAQRIYNECKLKNVFSFDSPVSGGDIGAREARLSIMNGGDKEAFEKIKAVMESYGKNIQYIGAAGQGQHCKMANQICIASTMLGVIECLIYGYKAGLDLDLMLTTIGSGAAGSFSLNVYTPRILKRDFEPGFFVEHFVKDMEIALQEAARMNLCLPGLALVKQFYTALIAKGGAQRGTQALILVLEDMNNIDLSKSRD